MDYLLALLQGLGIAAAIGIRPFLPVLLVGALATANLGVDFDFEYGNSRQRRGPSSGRITRQPDREPNADPSSPCLSEPTCPSFAHAPSDLSAGHQHIIRRILPHRQRRFRLSHSRTRSRTRKRDRHTTRRTQFQFPLASRHDRRRRRNRRPIVKVGRKRRRTHRTRRLARPSSRHSHTRKRKGRQRRELLFSSASQLSFNDLDPGCEAGQRRRRRRRYPTCPDRVCSQ